MQNGEICIITQKLMTLLKIDNSQQLVQFAKLTFKFEASSAQLPSDL